MRVNKKSTERWKTSNTCVYNCSYHFIWATKFRRKVFDEEKQNVLKQIIQEKCQAMNWEIKALEVMPDHIHLFLSTSPACAPQFIITQIKGYSSRMMREHFPELKTRMPSLWTRSYYVDTVGLLREETIKNYVEQQKRESSYLSRTHD